jgi:hypothetical protein
VTSARAVSSADGAAGAATGAGSVAAVGGDGGTVRQDARRTTRLAVVMSNEPGKAASMDFMRGLYRFARRAPTFRGVELSENPIS